MRLYFESTRMSSESDAIGVRWPAFANAMQANFRQLRLDNKLIDIIIAVDQKQIPAHRLLLASCSKFFHNLFDSFVTSIGNPTIRKCANLSIVRIERVNDANFQLKIFLNCNCSRFS